MKQFFRPQLFDFQISRFQFSLTLLHSKKLNTSYYWYLQWITQMNMNQ